MAFEIPQEMIERLDKGHTVTFEQVKALASPSERDRDPKLLMMAFGAALKRAMRLAGKPCTVRTLEQGRILNILRDDEASGYNSRMFRSYGRRQRRRLEEQAEVDTANLDNEQRKKHLHSLNVMGRIIVAADMARRTPQLIPAIRNIPTIGQQYGKGVASA